MPVPANGTIIAFRAYSATAQRKVRSTVRVGPTSVYASLDGLEDWPTRLVALAPGGRGAV